MSNTTRAKTVLQNLMDKTITNEKFDKIISLYLCSCGMVVNEMDLELKSTHFINYLKKDVKNRCQSEAIGAAQRANQEAEKLAAESIDSDFS